MWFQVLSSFVLVSAKILKKQNSSRSQAMKIAYTQQPTSTYLLVQRLQTISRLELALEAKVRSFHWLIIIQIFSSFLLIWSSGSSINFQGHSSKIRIWCKHYIFLQMTYNILMLYLTMNIYRIYIQSSFEHIIFCIPQQSVLLSLEQHKNENIEKHPRHEEKIVEERFWGFFAHIACNSYCKLMTIAQWQ